MKYTGHQEQALDAVRHWIDHPNGQQVFRLWGYAGTGKTTIAKALLDHTSEVCCAAFTGKAASVMRRKGLLNATTVHSLIYTYAGSDDSALRKLEAEMAELEAVGEEGMTKEMIARWEAVRRALEPARTAAQQPKFVLKDAYESDVSHARLVILDESSMVGREMGRDLLSFGKPVLVIGDPAQLPPVRDTGFFMDGEPDYVLTEVHRQAADSPIIALATCVREGRALPRGDFGAAQVVSSVGSERALAADQLLCGINDRRRNINARARQLAGTLGESPVPQDGEKLVCLRNNREEGLLNGTLWRSVGAPDWNTGDDDVGLNIVSDDAGGVARPVTAELCLFLDDSKPPRFPHYEQFTWGSCLTVHKAQGSQWDDVIVWDDWPKRDGHKEWLYTAVTRAAERLTVVV